jgi:hypothetical protein
LAVESQEQSYRQLYAQTKESGVADYSAGVAQTHGDLNVENVLRKAIAAGGHGANLRESIQATLLAGGAVGEDPAQMLLKTGVVGWT